MGSVRHLWRRNTGECVSFGHPATVFSSGKYIDDGDLLTMKMKTMALVATACCLVSQGWADETVTNTATDPAIQGNVRIDTTIAAPNPTENATPVSVTAPAPKRPEEMLNATTEEDTSAKKLSKDHKAIKITLKNTLSAHIEVLQAEVINGVDEQVIANMTQEKKATGRRMGSALLRVGQTGLSFVPYAGVGMGGLYALSAANHVVGGAAQVMDASAANGGAATTGQYVKRLNNVYISPNESYTFKAIIPKKDKAFFRVVFKDLTTNQIFNYQL